MTYMENHGPNWRNLPKHLLDMVLEKLESTRDYLQFGAVCLEWHSILKHNQISRIKKPRHKQMPTLLVPDKGEPKTWSIYDIRDNKFLGLKLSIPYDKRLCGSSQGWLVAIQKDYTVTLYKPYSSIMVKQGYDYNANYSNIIHLPPIFPPNLQFFNPDNLQPGDIDFREAYDFHVLKVVITADPLENPNECTIVVLYDEFYDVAFIRLADKDPAWVRVHSGFGDGDGFGGEDIIYYKNQFYALDQVGGLYSFQVTDPCSSTLKKVSPKIPEDGSYYVKRYLVVSSQGKLFQVERHCEFFDGQDGRATAMFKLYTMDFDKGKWIELESLGDDTLFLGDNSSICVRASNFIGCQRNCIYFLHDPDCVDMYGTSSYFDMGIYHVQTRGIEPYSDLDSTAFNSRPPIWVVPTFDAY